MDKIKTSCAYCKKTFANTDTVVVCPECGAPYHKECFDEVKQCIFTHKHGENFTWSDNSLPVTENSNNTYEENVDSNFTDDPNAYAQAAPNMGASSFASQYKKMLETAEMLETRTPDGYSKKEISAAVGPSTNYYFENFYRYQKKNNKKNFSLNFTAFLTGFLYFFYRKMYLEGLPFLLFFISNLSLNFMKIFANVSQFLSLAQNGGSVATFLAGASTGSAALDSVSRILLLISPLVSLIAGFSANYFYQKKTYANIEKARLMERPNMPSYYATIEKAGGINKTILVVFLFAMGISTLALAFIISGM